MTAAECEIVANAGVQLREIAERLTAGLPYSRDLRTVTVQELVYVMDGASLSISEVYGQLSALPIEVERPPQPPCPLCGGEVRDGYQYHVATCDWVTKSTWATPATVSWQCPDCGYLSRATRHVESHHIDCPRVAIEVEGEAGA